MKYSSDRLDYVFGIKKFPMTQQRTVSHEELSKHNNEASCWIAINGVVYDFTDFVSQHPGGANILLQNAGKDATAIFRLYHPLEFLERLTPAAIVGRHSPPPQNIDSSRIQKPKGSDVRLSHILNVYDFARNARKSLSKEAWDYLVSAADDVVTYRMNEMAFEKFFIKPRVLVNVSGAIDTSVALLGTKSSSPIYISATAMGRLYHPDGEMALARGAHEAGVIQMCPTLGSCSIEEVASARGPDQTQWFQL